METKILNAIELLQDAFEVPGTGFTNLKKSLLYWHSSYIEFAHDADIHRSKSALNSIIQYFRQLESGHLSLKLEMILKLNNFQAYAPGMELSEVRTELFRWFSYHMVFNSQSGLNEENEIYRFQVLSDYIQSLIEQPEHEFIS